jgi:pimeloyl-ACP methyl ester carboxylesterase
MALRIAVGVYVGLCIVLAVFQTAIIFPGSATQGRADCVVRPFQGSELVELKTKQGEKVVALFGPAMTTSGAPHPDAKNRPTLLYFYGNGMCMADCEGEFLKFRQRGFNVMIPDFLGYGMSGGKPSEAGVYATADACFDHVLERDDIDPKKIVPFGWSLGASAAIHLASTREVPALVTVSAFTSMSDMARWHYPLVPAKLFLHHHFENEQKMRRVCCPVLIAHGTRDSIIPFAMSKRLAEAAAGKVTKYDVSEGNHNDVYDVGGPELLDAIEKFVNDTAAGDERSTQAR